jgi:hypothetical protein
MRSGFAADIDGVCKAVAELLQPRFLGDFGSEIGIFRPKTGKNSWVLFTDEYIGQTP